MPVENSKPEQHFYKDDGKIPNSKYPVLIYRNVHKGTGDDAADWFADQFEKNGWTKSWRDSIYKFHHYHSTAHEVLGVYDGSATVQLGGEHGEHMQIKAGDVIILPAGTGHKQITADDAFSVVGAYDGGRDWDVMRGEPEDRPIADRNINNVPMPAKDPLTGAKNGLTKLWVVSA
jgi:uncharacterized protein YjlB